MRSMPHALSIAHTGITVRDLDASLAFWTQVLGAQLERRFELSGDFAADVTGVPDAHISAAVVTLGENRLELLQYLRPAERDHLCPRPCDPGSWHMALTVENIDDITDVVASCAEYGWRLAGTVRTMTDGPRAGARFAYLHDPDGATLELIQEARR